jgi:hypothetical protein
MNLGQERAEPVSCMALAHDVAEQEARAQEEDAVLGEPQETLSSAPGSQRLILLCSTCFLYDH